MSPLRRRAAVARRAAAPAWRLAPRSSATERRRPRRRAGHAWGRATTDPAGVMFDGLSFLNNTTAAAVTVTNDFAFATVLKWIWNQGGAQPVLWHNGVPSTNGMGLAANFTGASVWLVRTLHQFVDFGNYDVAYPMHIPVVLYWEKVGGVTTMYVNGLACPRASGSETIIAPGNGFWIGANGTNDVAAF